MPTPGLQVDQVAPAFVAVPGVSIEMLNVAATTTRSTTSASFVGVGVPALAEPGEIIGTFTAPVAGTYQIMVRVYTYGSGGNWSKYRAVFDYDTTPINVGDESWYIGFSGVSFVVTGDFVATVNLTAGTHKVKIQWLTASGTLYTADSLHNWKIQGTLVSGSGAGGTLVSSTQKTSSAQVISSVTPTWTDIGELSLNVDTIANEQVLIECMADINMTGGTGSPLVAVDIDGSVAWRYFETAPAAYQLCASFSFTSAPLTSGSHVIKVKTTRQSGGDPSFTVYGTPTGGFSYLKVTRFRGGLVPVRKDGTPVIDTPAAFNFTGPGIQVTNIGGTANINVSGETGIFTSQPFFTEGMTGVSSPTALSGSYTLGGRFIVLLPQTQVLGAYFNTQKTGAHTIRIKLWEYGNTTALKTVDVGVSGPGVYTGYFATPYSVAAADVHKKIFYITMWETSGTDYTTITTPYYINQSYTWRTHICYDAMTWYEAGDALPTLSAGASQTFPIDPILTVPGEIAGQIIPENVPILEYSSASVVNVKAAPGASSALGMVLNNGVRYTATSPLTVNLATTGIGGLDTGSEAISTWYYVYAVPASSTGYLFNVVCSVNAPSTGPTGYSVWRYLGAFRNNASSNIIKFMQVGANFEYATNTQPLPFTGAGSADGSLQTLSLTGHVPNTASQVHLGGYVQVNAAGAMYIFVDGEADTTSGTTRWNTSHARLGGNASGEVDHLNAWVPTSGTKQVGYFREVAYAECRVDCFGWVDGYLTGLPSQLQAKYTPDTKVPTLTYSAVGAINVAAAPGQPTGVLLTLQDGKQRVFSGTLAWAFVNGVADLGLDTGAEASSTWYYLYAVPKSGDDNQLSVRASVTATGPTGYSNFKYLGAFRNDGSSNIVKFYQIDGSRFHTSETEISTGSGVDASPVSYSLANLIPATASAWIGGGRIHNTSALYSLLSFWPDGDSGLVVFLSAYARQSNDSGSVHGELPTITSPKVIYYQRTCSSGSPDQCSILTRGWIDGNLR